MAHNDTDWEFTCDIRRTVILGKYMKHWGMPETRIVSRKDHQLIEVYSFPCDTDDLIIRVATVGASSCTKLDGASLQHEYLIVLPSLLGGATITEVMHFLINIAVHETRPNVNYHVGATIQKVGVMPSAWPTKSLLLDEPRGEPEDLSAFPVGTQHVELLWAIPIHENECSFIRKNGIDVFSQLESESSVDLIDPLRTSLITRA